MHQEPEDADQPPPSSTVDLDRLIKVHEIAYRTWPAYELIAGERIQVGYDLELSAIHGRAAQLRQTNLLPGCAHCLAAWSDLRAIAEAVMPAEATESVYRVRSFDRAWHLDAQILGDKSVRVQLVIEIRNRAGGLLPEIDCERRCLERITTDLRKRGVRPSR